MEAYTFTGTIVHVGDVQEFKSKKSGKLFVKRDIAIADDPRDEYPTILVGTLKKGTKKDNTEAVKKSDINKLCTVTFYPDGRLYVGDDGKQRAFGGNTITEVSWDAKFEDDDNGEGLDEGSGLDGDDANDMPF